MTAVRGVGPQDRPVQGLFVYQEGVEEGMEGAIFLESPATSTLSRENEGGNTALPGKYGAPEMDGMCEALTEAE